MKKIKSVIFLSLGIIIFLGFVSAQQSITNISTSNITCTDEYKPVCGEKVSPCQIPPCPFNVKTYSNKCFLEKARAKYLYEGPCTNTTTTCIDSDGGLTYSEKGELIVNGNVYEDVCTDSNFVKEYFCDNPPSYYDNYYCSNGCEDGACVEETTTCIDSDGGKNVLVVGQAETNKGGQGDWCDYSKGENKIYEAYCVNDTAYTNELIDCPSDKPYCNKGKCSSEKAQCNEDDGGKNPLILGTTFPSRIADHTGATDYCQKTSTGQPEEECFGSDCSLREFFCVEGSPDEFYNDIPCPSGCAKGVCSKIEPTEETGPIEIVETKEGVKEEIKFVEADCNGCILDKKCYPFGYRKSGEYCSENLEFVKQFEKETSCENNFECKSNVCISGECISEGLIKKILNWFRRMFGKE